MIMMIGMILQQGSDEMTYTMVFLFVVSILVGFVLGALLALYVFKIGDSSRQRRIRHKEKKRYRNAEQEQENRISQQKSRSQKKQQDEHLMRNRMHHADGKSWGEETAEYYGQDTQDYLRRSRKHEEESYQYLQRNRKKEERSY